MSVDRRKGGLAGRSAAPSRRACSASSPISRSCTCSCCCFRLRSVRQQGLPSVAALFVSVVAAGTTEAGWDRHRMVVESRFVGPPSSPPPSSAPALVHAGLGRLRCFLLDKGGVSTRARQPLGLQHSPRLSMWTTSVSRWSASQRPGPLPAHKPEADLGISTGPLAGCRAVSESIHCSPALHWPPGATSAAQVERGPCNLDLRNNGLLSAHLGSVQRALGAASPRQDARPVRQAWQRPADRAAGRAERAGRGRAAGQLPALQPQPVRQEGRAARRQRDRAREGERCPRSFISTQRMARGALPQAWPGEAVARTQCCPGCLPLLR